LTAAQLAAAQKATRPAKPEELAWAQLVGQWRADARGLQLDRAAFDAARAARRTSARTAFDGARIVDAAEKIEKAAFTRADLVEIVGAQLPVDTERTPRELVESAVDEVAVRLTAPRAAHQREGHERFTLDAILDEEAAVLDLVDARDDRAMLWINDDDTAHLSPDQKRAVENIGRRSPWLIQPLSAPAGAGKTTSMRTLCAAAQRRINGTVLVLAPTGKAVDVAVREGAGDQGYTIAKALQLLRDNQLALNRQTLVIVDEAAMVGTGELHQLLAATTAAGTKTVLVGDAHQLAPVKARGGMFAQLCTDLPWTQHLSAVWRMRDLTNAPRRWPSAMVGRPRCAAPSAGTEPMTACTAAIKSPWPPTPWSATKPTPPPGKTRYWSATPPKWPTPSTSASTTTPSPLTHPPSPQPVDIASPSATSSSPATTTPRWLCATPTIPRSRTLRCATGTAGASLGSIPTTTG
jgi:hypothetical protein